MSILISIEKLLSGKYVEGARMEFKKGWDPVSTMRTICAFANDFENEDSGYIIIGVEEKNGKAKRPIKGFDSNDFERVQKKLIGYCNLIQPSFFPRLSLEEIDDKQVLVIWVSAGSNRPYKVPDDVTRKHKTYNFRIRQFSSSIVPNSEQEELVQLTAKIPFDDRVNSSAKIDDLNFALMREHLSQTKSKLYIEVRVLPSSIEIISYSGIDPSLTQSDFEKGIVRTRRYRNRRIGSFLKELGLTEGKGTGIPIIYKVLKDNGSPNPIFDTDYPNRSFFVVEFPIYLEFENDGNNGGAMGGAIGGAMEITARQEVRKI